MSQDEAKQLRKSRPLLETELRSAGASIKGNTVRCIFHDDKHPSAGIYEKDGVWRFHCHRCDIDEDIIGIRARVNGASYKSTIREMLPDPEAIDKPSPRVFPTIEEMTKAVSNMTDNYFYHNPDTHEIDLVVYRQDLPGGGKKFLQASKCNNGFWMRKPPGLLPIFNRTAIRAAEQVIVVEGEKCVKIMRKYGFTATTSPMGSGKAKLADWSPLAGKDVVIFRDNDLAGELHQSEVVEILQMLNPVPKISIIDVQAFDLPPKGDCEQFLAVWAEDGDIDGGRSAMQTAISTATPVEKLRELNQLIEDTISGKRKSEYFPWSELSRLSKALFPGTITCICGDPGAGKSFFVLESIWTWIDRGLKVAAFFLEDDRSEHMLRIAAQICGLAELTDDEWVRDNPEVSRNTIAEHQEQLAKAQAAITVACDGGISLEDLAKWVERKASDGYRILVIDPITIATVSDKPWQDDKLFLITCKAAIRRHGVSLILVTHPRGGKTKGGLSDMSGGLAYPRFSHSVFWLNKIHPAKQRIIKTKLGQSVVEIDRAVRIGKSRHGKGGGFELGFIFDHATLRYAEQGIVVEDDKKKDSEP